MGETFHAPVDIVLSLGDVVEPDILLVAAPRAAIVGEENIQGAPDLMVEILSPSTRAVDENAKRGLYEKFGVREYWVVDPEAEAVQIWRLEGVRFRDAGRFARDAALTTPLLPGFRLELEEVFGN